MNGFRDILGFYLKKQLRSKSFIVITLVMAVGLSAISIVLGGEATGGALNMSEEEELYFLSLIFCIITMTFIMLYSNSASGEIAYLKTNRVMEIFMTSVRPLPLYIGINMAYCVAQLIQIGVVGAVLAVVNSAYGSGLWKIVEAAGTNGNAGGFIAVFVVFLILGYFVYSFINTSLVSVVGRAEDISGITVPVSFLVMVTYFMSMSVSLSGDSAAAAVASYIPFTSPSVMVTRYIYGYADIVQVLISIIILFAGVVVIAYMGSRFFTGGVNFYGSLRDYKKRTKKL